MGGDVSVQAGASQRRLCCHISICSTHTPPSGQKRYLLRQVLPQALPHYPPNNTASTLADVYATAGSYAVYYAADQHADVLFAVNLMQAELDVSCVGN